MQQEFNNWFTELNNKTGVGLGFYVNKKLEEVQSTVQKIEIYETSTFGNLMVIDGCTMLTSKDNFLYHEMMSHPILFTHNNPKRVVIIGGGDCGVLKEVLKHPVEKVTQIDIDEQVTRLAEKYFPELCTSNNDPRAELLFIDGIKWIKEAPDNSIDVLIVDSTDPVGPAVGLFNIEFYQNCLRTLKDDGIFVQQSESPLAHLTLLKEMRHAMQEAGFSKLQTIGFPQPCYPSGWWSATLASKNVNLTKFRQDAKLLRTLDTKYYSNEIHQASLATPPFLKQAFSDGKENN